MAPPVVDSAPNDGAAIVELAGLVDLVLIPLAPTPIEVDQLSDTVELLGSSGARWIVVPSGFDGRRLQGARFGNCATSRAFPSSAAVVPLSEAVARSSGDAPPRLCNCALMREISRALDLAGAPS